MKKLKTLCKVKKKQHAELRDDIVEAVRQPRHICEKCLRVSSKKELLCHPCKLDEWQR